jgi:type IV pilus assembly protein PilV
MSMRFQPSPRRPSASPRRARGATLLEVLIAVLIMAVGLLGIAALQSVSLRNTQGASERSNAVIQSYAMFDMLRANRDAARAGSYDEGWRCEIPEDLTTRINADRARWILQLQASMGPTACGRVTCGAVACEVGVRWDDSRATDGDDTHELVTQSRL